jgi:hypothetical protein
MSRIAQSKPRFRHLGRFLLFAWLLAGLTATNTSAGGAADARQQCR